MRWKSHWQPKSPKADWAEDIRVDLKKAFPFKEKELELKSLESMKRGDLMALQECIDDLCRNRRK